jgi:hypothetical protein
MEFSLVGNTRFRDEGALIRQSLPVRLHHSSSSLTGMRLKIIAAQDDPAEETNRQNHIFEYINRGEKHLKHRK